MKRLLLACTLLLFTGTAFAQEEGDDVIYTDSTTDSTVNTTGEVTTNVNSPPPSAIAPQFNGGVNSDLCTIGVAGAVQTQILGLSMGSTVRDMNCEKLKNAKTLYDMGMKVAAKAAWEADPDRQPGAEIKEVLDDDTKTLLGTGGVLSVLALLLLL